MDRTGDDRRRIGLVEILALVMTPLVWPVGVIMLVLSPAWNLRDKLIGALVPPGGYMAVLLLPSLLLLGMVTSSTCSGGLDSPPNVSQSCTGADLPVWQQDVLVGALAFLVTVWLALPILTGIYMAWRLRRWSSQTA
ncbi:MAG: hypothetical protein ACHQ0J_13690 [Candidatus Dormibacterales bacterium]